MIVFCYRCLTEFESATGREKYCTNACRQRAYRDRKRMFGGYVALYPVCQHCGKRMFQLRKGRQKKYCSASCRTMAYRERRKQEIE